MKVIKLYKTAPWFGAGKQFGWKGAGLGIDIVHIELADDDDIVEFHILGKKNAYYISIERARQLIRHYASEWIVRGVEVGIVPMKECLNQEEFQAQHVVNTLFP